MADYNADGFVDHVIAAGLASQEGNVTVHQMDGGGCHGSFPRERIVSVSAGRLGVYATAANAPEAENGFVVATEKTLAGFTATCHKLWEASFNLTARYPDTIVRAEIVDLDGDGIGEVVVQVDGPEETRDRVVVYDGTTPLEMFHFKEQGFESGWVSIAVADSMTAYVGTRSTLLKLSGSDFSEVTELGVNWLTGGRVRMVRDVEVLDNGRVVAVGQSSNCSAQSCPSSGSDVRGIVAIYDPATGYYGEMIAPDSRNYVAADSRDNRVVAVAGSRVLVSDDGGTTWLNRTIADPQGWYSYSFTDVAYVANDRILAAGTHTNVHTLFSSTTGAVIAASSDGGATWQNVTVPINNKTETIRALAATTNGLVLGLVTNVTGARIIRSTDNGFTWQNVTTGWKTDTYSLPRWLSLEGERGWAIAYGIAYQTTNGGLTWLPYLACTVNVTACPLELRPARDDNSYKLFGVAQWGNLSYILQSNGNDGQATSFSRPTTGASGPANRVHFVGGFAANATAVGVAAAEGSFTGWIREAWLNVTPRVTEGLDPCNCLTYHLSNDGGKTWRKVTPNFKTNFATGLPFQSKCPQGCALLWRIEFGRNSQWNELPRIGVLPSVKVDYITDAGNGSVRGTYMEDFSTMDAMAPGTNADWGSTGVGLSLPQAPAPRWQRWYTSALAFDARLNFTAEPSPDVVIAYERSIANEIATDPNPWIRINPGTGDLIHNPSPQGLTPRSPSSRAVQTKTHVAFGLNGTLHKEIPLGASMIQATPRTGLSGYEDRAVVYANPLSSKLSAYSAASATQYCCSPQPLSDIQWVTAFALRDYDPLVNRSVDLVVGAYDGSVTVVWANNSTIRWQSQLTEPSGRYTHMYDTTLHPFYGTYLAEAVIRWRQTTDDNGVPLPTEIEMAGRLIEYFDVVKQVLTENGPVTFKPRPQLYQLELLVWYPTSPHRLART
ncbi:MAG TPA: hypothetical protein VM681_05015 [Candidatus Thermoplasmatota archaeon]|nr:hypothetical protein [Candidatus Thermoplasmatota archaeon]